MPLSEALTSGKIDRACASGARLSKAKRTKATPAAINNDRPPMIQRVRVLSTCCSVVTSGFYFMASDPRKSGSASSVRLTVVPRERQQ